MISLPKVKQGMKLRVNGNMPEPWKYYVGRTGTVELDRNKHRLMLCSPRVVVLRIFSSYKDKYIYEGFSLEELDYVEGLDE